ncbi:MAG: hypothetical protein NVS9B14_01580 [Candidatus Acidiferrum sp.]
MLSDAGITLFGYTITMMQLLLAGSGLLFMALMITLARGKRIAMQRSVVTDEIAIQLGRIAAAVELLAGEAAARRMREEKPATNVTLPPAIGEEKHPIPYSIFGR